MSQMRTTEILQLVKNKNKSKQDFLVVDANAANTSTPFEVTGNVEQVAVSAAADEKIVIKGFVILGSGNSGRADILRANDTTTLLPAYFSNFSRASGSGNLNLELEAGEDLSIRTEGIDAADNVFFGISYYKVGV